MTHHIDVTSLDIRFVILSMCQYCTAGMREIWYGTLYIYFFMKRPLLSQSCFFSPSKALETFDVRVSNSASTLLLLTTAEPIYLKLISNLVSYPAFYLCFKTNVTKSRREIGVYSF